MITNTREEDQAAAEATNGSSMGRWASVYCALQARWADHVKARADKLLKRQAELAVVKSNRHYDEVEALKYYLTQRHRMAIAAWHSRPEAELINKAFFTALEAVAEIENSNQTVEHKVVGQRRALKQGKRAIKDIVAGRARTENRQRSGVRISTETA